MPKTDTPPPRKRRAADPSDRRRRRPESLDSREAPPKPALELRKVTRWFRQGNSKLMVLDKVNVQIQHGETVALVAPSGSGKTTLLQLAGLLESPNSGEVAINGIRTSRLNDSERTGVRRANLGFVYQSHNLLEEMTALENVMLPLLINGVDRDTARRRTIKLLKAMGIAKRANHLPAEMSGGEQQRCAIARAIIHRPKLLLADEPTGNLDPATGDQVFKVLMSAVKGIGLTMLISTHNFGLASRMARTIELKDRKITEAPLQIESAITATAE